MKTLALILVLFSAGLNTADLDWKKDRAVSSFSGLSVSSGIDVYLTQGGSEKLTIEAKGVDEADVKQGKRMIFR